MHAQATPTSQPRRHRSQGVAVAAAAAVAAAVAAAAPAGDGAEEEAGEEVVTNHRQTLSGTHGLVHAGV